MGSCNRLMDAYQAYRDFNRRLARGESASPPPSAGRAARPAAARRPARTRPPRLGVYTGGGGSHSWLWFVEVLERLGFADLSFPDHRDIQNGALDELDVLAVSGGDTFAAARALGPEGARRIKSFIEAGGLYLGSCAGAYLMLRSSKEPLNLFNLVDARITNLADRLPRARALPEKFCTPYGCRHVYHPVREAVRLEAADNGPFAGAGEFSAPLYGGPAMVEAAPGQVLARYQGFTDKTLFLVDRDLAAETLLGRTAALRAELGRGWLYLFGPHFEHPRYPQANRLLADAIYWNPPEAGGSTAAGPASGPALTGREAKLYLREIKRWLSNARIAALAMEDSPVRWTIGRKVYEPAKFRVYLEAVWGRLRSLERTPVLLPARDADKLPGWWQGAAEDLRRIKRKLDQGRDAVELAADLFPRLNRAAARFMQTYFQTVLGRLLQEEPGERLH